MAKRVSAEDKDHDVNEIRKHYEHKTRREKHESNILISDEKKKAHDIMEDTEFMTKEYLANQRSHQRGFGLLIFFQNNELHLDNNNNEKLVSHLQTK